MFSGGGHHLTQYIQAQVVLDHIAPVTVNAG
jgi:hypothetical protein